VRGERVRTFKGARASLLRSRGRGSNQRKASWVRVRCGANPTIASLGPGRTGFLESSEERSVQPRPATEDVRGLVRPVRLPQPMGAGGQQPLRSQPLNKGCRQYAAPAGKGRSYHGETPCYPECLRSATRSVDPAPGNRPRTMNATAALHAPCGGSPRLKG